MVQYIGPYRICLDRGSLKGFGCPVGNDDRFGLGLRDDAVAHRGEFSLLTRLVGGFLCVGAGGLAIFSGRECKKVLEGFGDRAAF